jgi:hypothetical protein
MTKRKIKTFTASEWSKLSTKRQIDAARFHGKIHVTWWGRVEMIVTAAPHEGSKNEQADVSSLQN